MKRGRYYETVTTCWDGLDSSVIVLWLKEQ